MLNTLKEKLDNHEWITSIQIDPFETPSPEFMKDLVRKLAENGIRIVDINTSSKGIKQDSLHMACGLEMLDMRTIPHITPRDSLTNGVLSQVLGAYTWGGVRNILAIHGDPREYTGGGVYESDVLTFIRSVHDLRQDRHLEDFLIGCAFSQTRSNLDEESRRLKGKIESGADFIMTQPLFYRSCWEEELDNLQAMIPRPLLVGLWPFFELVTPAKIRNGYITGVDMPTYTSEKLIALGDDLIREQAKWIAEMMNEMEFRGIAGVYIVTPFRKKYHQEFLEFLSLLKENEGVRL